MFHNKKGINPQTVIKIASSAENELKWNVATISTCTQNSSGPNRANVYQQHKTLSAALMHRDCAFERAWDDSSCWAASTPVSEKSFPQTNKQNFLRAFVIASLIVVRPGDNNGLRVCWTYCFDFGGAVHVSCCHFYFSLFLIFSLGKVHGS
jgi:hypothetical protein